MSQIETEAKIIKVGNELAVQIPPEIIQDLQLQEGSMVTLIKSKHNKFEVIAKLKEGKVSCQICGQSPGKYTCQICGTFACSNCFWELGSLCNNCIKKK